MLSVNRNLRWLGSLKLYNALASWINRRDVWLPSSNSSCSIFALSNVVEAAAKDKSTDETPLLREDSFELERRNSWLTLSKNTREISAVVKRTKSPPSLSIKIARMWTHFRSGTLQRQRSNKVKNKFRKREQEKRANDWPDLYSSIHRKLDTITPYGTGHSRLRQ